MFTVGKISSFTISSSSLSNEGNFFISGSATGNEYFISASKFNVKASGDITGSQVLFTGGTIGGWSLNENQLSAEGVDICNLSAGEPDFDAPKEVIEATSKAIFDGFTKYGPAAGNLDLREAIANKLQIQNDLDIEFENVMVTNGAKQAIYNLFQVFFCFLKKKP